MPMEHSSASDKPSSFLVASPAAPWAAWTNHKLTVVGQVSTPFDEPGHPCGKWTARLRWVYGNDTYVVLSLDFLVAAFEFEPGTKLGFFLGRRLVADLTVRDRAQPIVNIEPTRTVRCKRPVSPFTPVAHEASAVKALTQSLVEAEDERILEAMEREASESDPDGVSTEDPGVD